MPFPQYDPNMFTQVPQADGSSVPVWNGISGQLQMPQPSPALPPYAAESGPVAPITRPDLPPAPELAPAPALSDATVNPFVPPSGPVGPSGPPPTPSAPAPRRPATPLGQRLGAYDQAQDIASRQGDVEAQGAQAEADVYRQGGIDAEKLNAERAAERQREEKDMATARAGQQQAIDKYANAKIDQNRWWHDQSTPHKIFAGIGVALAGLGSAMKGQGDRNPALDIIMKSIDQDIRLQEADRAKLGQIAGMKREAMGDLRQQFGDNEARFQAQKAASIGKVQNQVQQIAASSKVDAVKLNAEKLNADLDLEKANATEQAHQREIENKRAQQQVNISAGNLGLARQGFEYQKEKDVLDRTLDARKLDIAAQKAEADAKKASLDADKALSAEERQKAKDDIDNEAKVSERTIYGPSGEKLEPIHPSKSGFTVADPTRARELQKKMSNATKMVELSDTLVRLRDAHGWKSDLVKDPEFQKMKQIVAEMQLTEKDVKELGAISGSDAQYLINVIGVDDPTSMRDPTPGVRQFRKSLVAGLDNDMRTNGVKFDAKKAFPELTGKGIEEAARNTPAGTLIEKAQGRIAPGEILPDPVRDQLPPLGDVFARTPGLTGIAPKGASATTGYPGEKELTPEAQKAVLGMVSLASGNVPGSEQARQWLRNAAKDPNPRMRGLIGSIAAKNPNLGIDLSGASE